MDLPYLRKAIPADADRTLALYRACIGMDGCTWNELYPSMEDVVEDIAKGYLYLWEQSGALMGAVSLLADDDIEHIGLAFRHPGKPCVLCRLCVSPDRRHSGNGAALLAASERQAAALGYATMHLLVDLRQRTARALYQRSGYTDVGRAAMYGHEYYAMEKPLMPEPNASAPLTES